MKPATPYPDLPTFAAHLRKVLDPEQENKKCILLFAYNGTGKTRLSMDFRNIGKAGDTRDTLYFNAFTEDLFSWDNDLDGDSDRKLKLNKASRFFEGLRGRDLDTSIRVLLRYHANFDFVIEASDQNQEWTVRFFYPGNIDENIKVSRGEENLFIWCFFLAIAELAIAEADAYKWVKFIYIDDPISSLDEHNAVAVANRLAQMLKREENNLKTVISTHHTLFFNVLCNDLKKAKRLFLMKGENGNGYLVRDTGDTPFFYHVAKLVELRKVADSGSIYTYHFGILRSLLEKAASFHGLPGYASCVKRDDDDADGMLHARLLALLSHGSYSLFEPVEMVPENKEYFRRILNDFVERFPFNPELFAEEPSQANVQ